jgi:hypothetical protein
VGNQEIRERERERAGNKLLFEVFEVVEPLKLLDAYGQLPRRSESKHEEQVQQLDQQEIWV